MSLSQNRRPRTFASSMAIAGLTATLIATPAITGTATAEPINSGNICWGVKESFRNYLNSIIARGSMTPSGDAKFTTDGEFQFPITGGDTDTTITASGGAHFRGHSGILRTDFLNPSLEMTDADSAILTAYTSSNDVEGKPVVNENSLINLATVEFSSPVTPDGESVGKVVLTEEGAKIFSNYKAGTEMDDLRITQDACGDATTPTTPSTPTTTPSAPTTTTAPTAPEQRNEENNTDTKNTCSAVQTAKVSWGVKESFRTYIKGGIAKGTWEVDGVSDKDGLFNFTGTKGSVDVAEKSGTLETEGTVTFTGHNGKLKLEISHPKLQFSGNSGTLLATVNSNDTEGNPHEYGEIALAKLAIGDLKVTDAQVTGSAVTTLTEEGSKAFAGFYEAGSELDPITFTAALSGDSECDVQQANDNTNGTGTPDNIGGGDTTGGDADGNTNPAAGKAKGTSTNPSSSSSEKSSKGSRGTTAKLASTGGDAADGTELGDTAAPEIANQASSSPTHEVSPVQFAAIAATLLAVAAGCVYLNKNGVRLRRR